jgi:2-polyprenyl-6-methoxyphenol hydroxylase-like FAD-dependent oxidoreductase
MTSVPYDVVTVGGGMAASALAGSLGRKGLRVLVLEKETRFKDRVRGEYLCPWGLAEAKELGILDALMKSCGNEQPWVDMGFGPRDLRETTPQRMPSVSFFHPEMQEALLGDAERAGAEVRRGVCVTNVIPSAGAGENPSVMAKSSNGSGSADGRQERIAARLVVVADGRGSVARKWAGFTAQSAMDPFHFAGVLMEGVAIRKDLCTIVFNPELGLVGGLVPQGNDRVRTYLGYPSDGSFRLQGSEKLSAFLSEARKVAPVFADSLAQAKAVGPLAAFDGGYVWVEHPHRAGVALIGEAAALSDPSFGQGMSLSLRDARVLRDALLTGTDWEIDAQSYAQQHDAYFQRTRTVCRWQRSLLQEQGPAADARRAKAMPKIAEDLTRVPDHLFSGPDMPLDETVRARFFGEC